MKAGSAKDPSESADCSVQLESRARLTPRSKHDRTFVSIGWPSSSPQPGLEPPNLITTAVGPGLRVGLLARYCRTYVTVTKPTDRPIRGSVWVLTDLAIPRTPVPKSTYRIGLTMIVLGIILLLIGYFTSLSILYTIGGILVVVGIVLWILGAVGRPVGGRKVWF